jgi:hemoglobin-like flavoprotein
VTSQRAEHLASPLPRQRDRDLPADPGSIPVPVPAPRPRPASRDVLAIQASLAAVQQRPAELAESFYMHLFEIVPGARGMFAPDMSSQMQRMTDVLVGTIGALHAETINPPADRAGLERRLHNLGLLHRDRWNIVPEHYLYIGHALTRAVRDVAGPAWSGSLSSSWISLAQWICTQMLCGHHGCTTPEAHIPEEQAAVPPRASR